MSSKVRKMQAPPGAASLMAIGSNLKLSCFRIGARPYNTAYRLRGKIATGLLIGFLGKKLDETCSNRIMLASGHGQAGRSSSILFAGRRRRGGVSPAVRPSCAIGVVESERGECFLGKRRETALRASLPFNHAASALTADSASLLSASSVFFSSANVASSSFTASSWPSLAAQVFSVP
jgi:hypothetical protein